MIEPDEVPRTARGTNLYIDDINLQRLLERRAPEELRRNEERLADFGAWAGGPLDEQAEYTDRHAPPRHTPQPYGPNGHQGGAIVFNPRYLACHAEAYARGAVGLPYQKGSSGRHLACFTLGYLLSQADVSIHCPVTMTGAVAHVLNTIAPDAVRDRFLPDLIRMDGKALSGGTWATELHGGSDVGASTTRAVKTDEAWALHGLKWFTSNAGSGLALATARPEGAPLGGKGLGCYLVPSHLEDGRLNAHTVRRLKEKVGTRGLATAELDLLGATAFEVAGPGEGLKVMMAALEYSRIHNAVASAGLLRRAFVESLGWSVHRPAFGQTVIRYPMVQDQLLDMQMELEAAVALSFESVFAFDALATGDSDPEQGGDWLRLVTALAKYRTADQAVKACRTAVEMVGGNGYTEEFPTARLYRDCLVTAVWEGPANIQALELLRLVAGKRPGDQIFLGRVGAALSDLPPQAGDTAAILEGALEECRAALAHLRRNPDQAPRHGRRLLDLLSDTLATALLCEEAVADLKLGDGRKLLIANRFAARVLAHHNPIATEVEPALAAFEDVILYQPVE
ncbi:acyl-CoA dehydrogenase family protein [Nitrospirillum iridis]|uniref:Alkylation response protein AidB-like acyl-CoA dehydrogenase n=1 Tax=Nitrospirillum iridis TaxID=765888 RepID=A0A7X0AYP8_9PROT|nr:acyl-CoA dehydrogenase family protein [Nitrospirillum iridis]MBB6252588.1 alkylation response protein AidB-like acyl-CoA dehydrogenase [Nitrospirillum iridis]